MKTHTQNKHTRVVQCNPSQFGNTTAAKRFVEILLEIGNPILIRNVNTFYHKVNIEFGYIFDALKIKFPKGMLAVKMNPDHSGYREKILYMVKKEKLQAIDREPNWPDIVKSFMKNIVDTNFKKRIKEMDKPDNLDVEHLKYQFETHHNQKA